jgi:trehalose 6-phosphate synthase/phosphatase
MEMKTFSRNRLIVVSNRLPIVLAKDAQEEWRVEPGSGGLVTALAPVLRNRGGLWIGWPGYGSDEADIPLKQILEDAVSDFGYAFKTVSITTEEIAGYYYGFSNRILWPLFHDFQARCHFAPEYWRFYESVNQRFAEVVAENTDDDSDYIWVHDYHLMGVGNALRKIGVSSRIGYFLHTPFPPLDIFIKLPWRFEILKQLLSYDLIGLQTRRDRRNFVQCVHAMLKGVRVTGQGRVISTVVEGRKVRIGHFPTSIDFDEFVQTAQSSEVEKRLLELKSIFSARHLVLGVDRLDYTKGIPERLMIFRNALRRFPDLHSRISLVQVVVPSRVKIPEYNDLKQEIELLVSEINGEFTQPGWVPIHYLFRGIDRTELVALYRAADIAFITPLKDGMNLIAKEYCASNIFEDGVLMLSEFAGAACQLYRDALILNPYHTELAAEKLYQACQMPTPERKKHMRALRREVQRSDIYWWMDSFLDAALQVKPAVRPQAEPVFNTAGSTP